MSPAAGWKGPLWATLIVIAIVSSVSFTALGRDLVQGFLASLRIAKPDTVNAPSPLGSNPNGQLKDAIAEMISDKVSITLDESDQSVSSLEAAAKLAGFGPLLLRARNDSPAWTVAGAHASEMIVNRAQMLTIFAEAGKTTVQLPQSLDGAKVTIQTPRSVRSRYGNCPAPVANTLQNQIQGPPPPSTDNGDCVILLESPVSSVDIPSGLDMEPLLEIGLELSGMSPNQALVFEKTIDWKSSMGLSMPRFLRSYDSVEVNGTRGILLNTGGRRGPTYQLIWAKNGMVYSLSGFGNSGDAVPLARSAR